MIPYQILPLIVVELSIFEHLNVISFHQKSTVLNDQQGPANTTGIRINPDFSVTDVPDHRDLCVDDVHLTSQLAKSQHQLLGIAMNTNLHQN